MALVKSQSSIELLWRSPHYQKLFTSFRFTGFERFLKTARKVCKPPTAKSSPSSTQPKNSPGTCWKRSVYNRRWTAPVSRHAHRTRAYLFVFFGSIVARWSDSPDRQPPGIRCHGVDGIDRDKLAITINCVGVGGTRKFGTKQGSFIARGAIRWCAWKLFRCWPVLWSTAVVVSKIYVVCEINWLSVPKLILFIYNLRTIRFQFERGSQEQIQRDKNNLL